MHSPPGCNMPREENGAQAAAPAVIGKYWALYSDNPFRRLSTLWHSGIYLTSMTFGLPNYK
jgi:hypothetical protein